MEEVKKIYFSLREVEQSTGLRASTLRYWETQFEELNPRKDAHGDRYYTEEDIAFLKQVKFIRDELKITRIEAIKNELKSGSRNIDARQRATDILQRIRQQLVDLRASL
ncbi:MAG: MerR family transcriptional regulator [Paludibacteraceae bacterium]|nr:MerR family transcriptional regulator [Paludibacteraceae bacterium]